MKRIQTMESLVLVGNAWSSLRYKDIIEDTAEIIIEGYENVNREIFVSSMFETIERRIFVKNKDYELDAVNGMIRRTSQSNIRDFRESVFWNKKGFDHQKFNGRWGNYPFMVYISYIYEDENNSLIEDEASNISMSLGTCRLNESIKRLMNGESLTYLVYGDSISTGCEALYFKDSYFELFKNKLERITSGYLQIINESIGGETSREGAFRFQSVIERHRPDIVTLAYGINDMCLKSGKPDVSIEEYISNMSEMLYLARSHATEVILITNCLPNPNWKFTSQQAKDYASGLRTLAKEKKVALADVQALWDKELQHGKQLSDLLLNDINHPTSYGHRLYYEMLKTLI